MFKNKLYKYYSFFFSMKSILTFCIFSISTLTGNAQDTVLEIKEKRVSKLKNKAQQALRTGDPYIALAYYQKLAEKKVEDAETQYKLAELYRVARDYVNAETYYRKTVDLDKEGFPEALLALGQMQKCNGKYEEARASITQFKKLVRKEKNKLYNKTARIELEGCDLADTWKDTTENAFLTHLNSSINHPHIEFSPIPMGEELFAFGSLREDQVYYYEKDSAASQSARRKFFLAEKTGSGWQEVGELPGPFNDPETVPGNGCLSEDGKRFYFTRCDKNWKNETVCRIFCTEKKSNVWQEPYLLNSNINSGNYTATQPTLGKESRRGRDVLYFVSNRPGGKGGLDIWYSIYDTKKKQFKEAKNAGSKINTYGTDCTPFYDIKKKTLYFSSDGWPAFGGLDVFKAIGESKRWTVAENLGKPINSTQDDLDFVLRNEETGFFVSNRPGGTPLLSETCCDDIYAFKWREFIKVNLLGKVNENGDCLRGTAMIAYIVDGEERIAALNQDTDDCSFDVELEVGYDYSFVVEKDGYHPDSTTLSTKNITSSTTLEAVFDLKPKRKTRPKPKTETTAPKPEPLTFENKVINRNENIRLKDIYYEFDRDELTPTAKRAIDNTLLRFLSKYPTASILISSHTDSKGTDEYNRDLSQRRAQSVVNYLIANGIATERLQAKGFGENQPVAPNQFENGRDNPEGRALNRRTEFKVLDF